MVVDRRHAEHPLAGQLERRHLNDHRQGLDHEEAADDDEHDLVLDRDRNGTDEAAERERPRVAHEDLRRRRVEPEEADTGPDDGAADDRQLARLRHVVDAEIGGEEQVAGEISDEAEGGGRHHDRNDGKAVEPVGQVHGIAGRHDDERPEGDEEGAEVDHVAVDEGQREAGGAGGTDLHHRPAGDGGDRGLDDEAQAPGEALVGLLRHLEVVVVEADHAEADGHEQHDPHIAARRVGPEQRRDDEAREDHQAAHGGRARLGEEVRLRAVEADRLALALLQPQRRDDRRPEKEDEESSGRRRADRAERQVTEQVQRAEIAGQFGEPDEHRSPQVTGGAPPKRSLRAATNGPIRLPLEPFTMTTSPAPMASASGPWIAAAASPHKPWTCVGNRLNRP